MENCKPDVNQNYKTWAAYENAKEKMNEIINNAKMTVNGTISYGPSESSHYDADMVLCDLLCSMGCKEIVELYLKLDKWYA